MSKKLSHLDKITKKYQLKVSKKIKKINKKRIKIYQKEQKRKEKNGN